MRAGLSALLALLAAAASVSVPVAAQGAELVSNRDQTRAAFSNSSNRSAQVFTTGDRAGGYVLSSVRVSSRARDDSYSAALHTLNSSGHPSTKVADLTAPSGFTGTVETFTAPENTFLAPETSYAVVVSSLDNIALTASNAEDTGAASGWSIADAYVWQASSGWQTTNSGRSVMLAIDGEERTNRPATGTVSISGAGRVGQMLAASVSEVADDDGLPDTVSYAYQWVRVDGTTETDVGTDSAQYMPVAADAGKRIKVRASFTDSVGFDETLESAAVPVRGMNPTACAANTPGPARTEIWSATLTVGAGSVSYGYTVFSYGGLTDGEFELGSRSRVFYGVFAATAASSFGEGSLTTVIRQTDEALSAAERADLRLHVCGETYDFADAAYTTTGGHIYTWPTAGLDWSSLVDETRAVALSTVANADPTGRPAISGRAQVGSTVTALTASIRDANGLDDAEFAYQWIRVEGTSEEDIAGETASTYALAAADVGKRVKVKVSFTDDDNFDETVTSAAFPMAGTIRGAPPAMVDPSALLSATLVAKKIDNASGCSNSAAGAECSDEDVLSEDEFSFANTDYSVERMFEIRAGTVTLALSPIVPSAARELLFSRLSLSVTVGVTTTALAFSDASPVSHNTGADRTDISWGLGAAPWSEGDTVTVAIRDAGTGDVTPPKLASDAPSVPAGGRSLSVTFDEDLDGDNLPPASAFTVTAGGTAVEVSDVAADTTDAGVLTLALGSVIMQGQAVLLGYTDPTAEDDTNALQDAAGNDVATFANVAVTNSSTVVGVPGPPTGLMATADGGTRIDLSWTAPAEEGDSAITGYRVEWSADGTSDWTVLKADTGDTDTSHTDSGLSSETRRHYRVSAINSFGAGPPSDSANATTDDIEGPVPQSAEVNEDGDLLTIVLDEVVPGLFSRDRATITADGVPVGFIGGDPIQLGTVRHSLGPLEPPVRAGQVVRVTYTDPTSGDDTDALQDEHGNDAASFTLGPDPGDLFAVTNNSTVQPTVPDAPTGLDAESLSLTEIQLSWTAPEDNGGRAITGYHIEYCTTSCDQTTATWQDVEADTDSAGTAYTDTGLEADTTRTYRVSAINAIGTGAPSDTVEGTTADPVGRVTITVDRPRVGEGETVTWTATAVTTRDEAPPSNLDLKAYFEIRHKTGRETAGDGLDYRSNQKRVQFASADFSRQTVAGEPRYVASKSIEIEFLADGEIETDEGFDLEGGRSGDPGWSLTEPTDHEIRIEDRTLWSVAVTAQPSEIVEGETREVTLTATRTPEQDAGCASWAVDVELAVAGTVSEDDYTATPAPGQRRLEVCDENPMLQWKVSLATVLDAADDDGETVTFTPEVTLVTANEIRVPDSVQAATVTIREVRAVVIDAPERLEVAHDGTESYTVRLATRPTGTVTVRPQFSGDAATVSPAALSFTASTWHREQTVSVSGVPAAVDDVETGTLTHTVSGADYNGVSARSIPVEVSTGPQRYGQVRLREQQTQSDGSVVGRLEVGYHGRWGTVCDDRFAEAESPELACRLAGFETGEVTGNRNSATFNRIPPHESPWWRGVPIPGDVMPIWLDDVVCDEGSTHWTDEAPRRLDQCWNAGVGLHNCTREEDVWLKCSGTYGGAEQVRGRPIVYVRDASATEGTNANMTFKVWLTRVLTGTQTVTVNYATVAVSDAANHLGVSRNPATEGKDYTPTMGVLEFTSTSPTRPRYHFGELTAHMDHTIMELEIQVPIIDDSAPDSGEIFRMELSNIVGGAQFSVLSGNRATGIIFNHEDDTSVQAQFRNTPHGHDGSAFTVELAFAEMIEATPESIGAALSVAGGTLDGVSQLEAGDTRYWSVSVTPATAEDAVTVTLESNAGCGETGAVCTSDGRQLREAVEITIATTTPLAEAPAITGIAQVGNTLEAAFAEEPGGEISWQWLRGEEPIEGAGEPSYKVNEADAGHTLSVQATRGGDTVTSTATVPVWPAPSHPGAASGEEELFSTTITLGSDRTYPAHLGGYGDLSGVRFGESDTATFAEEGTGYTLTLFMVNQAGEIGVATEPPIAGGGLVAYWNRERIEGFESQPGPGGETVLSGETAHTGAESMRYTDGSADGVRVGVTLRRAYEAARIVAAYIASGPGDNGTWDTGETVEARMRFSAPVRIVVPEGRENRRVEVPVNVGRSTTPRLRHASGSGTDTLTFVYTVDDVANGATQAVLGGMRLILNGLKVVDGNGRNADVRYSPSPQIESVSLTADTSGDRAWTEGETVEARLAFNEAVTVEDGTPALGIAIAGEAGTLGYASGSGSGTLVFSRSVGEGERFSEIAVTADSLALNGARIVSGRGMEAAPVHAGTEPTAAPAEVAPLTAAFTGLPAAHGNAAFTVELAFSETLAESFSYRTLAGGGGTGVLSVTNGTVTGAERIVREGPERNRRWSLGVTPNGDGDVTVTLAASPACTETGAVCTGDGRALSAAVTATVPESAGTQGPDPFTVALADVPAEHDGANAFTFELAFSEEPRAGYSYETLRDDTLEVRQGATRLVPYVKRLDAPRNRRWAVTVTPSDDAALSKADITVSVGPKSSCDAAGAVCTAEGEALSNTATATVPGPVAISVADAEADEAEDASVDFIVSLNRAATSAVSVDYATADGTASAGEDYTGTAGTLVFAVGEREKTIAVAVLDDDHDEGEETFTLTLSDVEGNAYLADAEATGTIANSDHMPKAWLGRFGRTVAEQVIEAAEGRFAAPRSAGVEVSLAGQALQGATAGERDALEEREAEARLEAMSRWLAGEREDDTGLSESRALTGRDLVLGSSFALTGGTPEGGYASVWGRGAVTRFDGREGALTLSGEVTSAMLGADFERELGMVGLMLTHSRGEGSYRGEGEGEVSSTLTGLYPYGRYRVNQRVTLWGVAGYGEGELMLAPEGRARMEAGMDLMMGAAGVRGVALEAPADGGLELSVTSDAMAVRTSSQSTQGMAGAEADVTRLRLGLEGSWHGLGSEAGGTFVPRFEVGVRHDGGDAETGFGVDVGAGLSWSHPGIGLSAELSGRGLLSHEADGFRDRGFAGSLTFDPRPDSDRGLALTVSQAMGAQASGGMDALLGQRHLEGVVANDAGDELSRRALELRLGYGFAVFGDRFTATPEAGLGLSGGQREYSLGWRLALARREDVAFELGLEATRREAANDDGTEPVQALMLRGSLRW